jgi:hypothetical protein
VRETLLLELGAVEQQDSADEAGASHGVIRTDSVNNPVARRNRVANWPEWILSAITTCLLLYALAVIGSEYTPMPDESLRERVRGMVLLTWYVVQSRIDALCIHAETT